MKIIDSRVVCPGCGTRNDGATVIGDDNHIPEDDDLSVCLYCQAFTKFIDGGKAQRLLTQPEFWALPKRMRELLMKMKRVASSLRVTPPFKRKPRMLP